MCVSVCGRARVCVVYFTFVRKLIIPLDSATATNTDMSKCRRWGGVNKIIIILTISHVIKYICLNIYFSALHINRFDLHLASGILFPTDV